MRAPPNSGEIAGAGLEQFLSRSIAAIWRQNVRERTEASIRPAANACGRHATRARFHTRAASFR
jgi:hypothetical protein